MVRYNEVGTCDSWDRCVTCSADNPISNKPNTVCLSYGVPVKKTRFLIFSEWAKHKDCPAKDKDRRGSKWLIGLKT